MKEPLCYRQVFLVKTDGKINQWFWSNHAARAAAKMVKGKVHQKTFKNSVTYEQVEQWVKDQNGPTDQDHAMAINRVAAILSLNSSDHVDAANQNPGLKDNTKAALLTNLQAARTLGFEDLYLQKLGGHCRQGLEETILIKHKLDK